MRLTSFIIGAAIALLTAAPAFARPAMWVIRDADSEIVLFGSVHALPPGLDWTPPALSAALALADDVWFEIPQDDAAALASAQAATMKGLLPRGQTLSSRLDARTRERLAKVVKDLGLPAGMLEPYKPWMADVILATAFAQKQGAVAAEGVEARVAATAPSRAQKRAFETVEQQIAILADASEADQIASLKESVDEISQDPAAFTDMVRTWMSGDIAALYKKSVEPMKKDAPNLYRRLIVARNQAWIGPIEQRLKGQGRTVMVMGAGHFAGPDGLPALLRKRGLMVEGP